MNFQVCAPRRVTPPPPPPPPLATASPRATTLRNHRQVGDASIGFSAAGATIGVQSGANLVKVIASPLNQGAGVCLHDPIFVATDGSTALQVEVAAPTGWSCTPVIPPIVGGGGCLRRELPDLGDVPARRAEWLGEDGAMLKFVLR